MKDEFGAERHTLTKEYLDDLYRRLDEFIADCTKEEVDLNREAINKVQTMIHQHGNKGQIRL